MKVNNKGVLRRLTWRSLKASRFRNIMAIVAIALTSVLFTSIATMGGAMIQSVEESTFRQVGSNSHGGYKYLNEEQYEKIVAAGEYKDISYNIILGFATNPELSKKQHELRYSEDDSARWGFSYPTVGTMPKEYKDIAVSTLTLDLLGLPHELGQTIHLDFTVDGVLHSDDFVLVGYWPGDDVMQATQCWLSKEYVRSLAPDPGENAGRPDSFTGTVNANVWFEDSMDIEAKLDKLTLAAGLDPDAINIGVNWGYVESGPLDFTTVVLVVTLLLIVMISGYLIIFSIFAISVSNDIQFYGLLKTIGTTGRQIKRIVRGQALALSVVGIPVGLLLGFFLGTRLAPVMMRMTNYDAPDTVHANLWVFVLAAAFSLITVFISCRKPGRMAAKVSPIEALRYTEGMEDYGEKRERKHRRIGKKRRASRMRDDVATQQKSSRKVTPFSLAWANINRSRRKLVTVVLSLSLSMVLLNSVVSATNGFDMDVYLESQAVSDIYFSDAAMFNAAVPFENRNFEAIPDELIQETQTLPGLEASGRIFFKDYTHYFESDAARDRFENIVRPYMDSQLRKDVLDAAVAGNYTYFQIYGLDEMPFGKIRENYQKIDWEKLDSGRYALLRTFDGSNDDAKAYYPIGSKIPLVGADGQTVEYEVIGYMEYPHAMSSQFGSIIECSLVISSDEFAALFGEHQPFSFLVDVEDEYIEETEAWAEELTSGRMSELSFRSKSFYVDEFKGVQSTYMIIGGVLAFILALIGILNFINTMATSIMTRKRELAMLQSVGMTNAQLRQMLFFEGLWHAILTIVFTLTVGSVISAALIQGIAGSIWFFTFKFSLTPMLICAPILLALCAVIPILCGRILQRESIVERLREN